MYKKCIILYIKRKEINSLISRLFEVKPCKVNLLLLKGDVVCNINTLLINGKAIEYIRINNDISGNPRYVIHFLNIADNYEEAIKIAKKIGGKKYRAKWYGGGIVISSYSLENDLKQVIK